ncbi:MAG TPA: hypothetical protein VIC56_05345 [Gemmatimonadota bacterium]
MSPTISHVNQKVPDLVTLDASSGNGEFGMCSDVAAFAALRRVYPDGARLPFTVPRGKFLVVTDVALHATVDETLPPGSRQDAYLRVRNPVNGNEHNVLVFTLTQEPPASVAVTNLHLTTGFTVGPGMQVCVSTKSGAILGGFNISPHYLMLHGYLVRFP